MSSNGSLPDYDLDDVYVVNTPHELRAMIEPVRDTILDLLLERAATVSELAAAVRRPKSSVAYHVNVLVDAGLLKVVRTRKVRAIEERYYGRRARIFYVGSIRPGPESGTPQMANYIADAARESAPAHEADDLRALLRYARIAPEVAAEFWRRVFGLVNEYMQLPRSGDQSYGFVVGLYPTERPALPDP
jgi:DNA-binding transcriptional ArsR family regulator